VERRYRLLAPGKHPKVLVHRGDLESDEEFEVAIREIEEELADLTEEFEFEFAEELEEEFADLERAFSEGDLEDLDFEIASLSDELANGYLVELHGELGELAEDFCEECGIDEDDFQIAFGGDFEFDSMDWEDLREDGFAEIDWSELEGVDYVDLEDIGVDFRSLGLEELGVDFRALGMDEGDLAELHEHADELHEHEADEREELEDELRDVLEELRDEVRRLEKELKDLQKELDAKVFTATF